jgi:hypothetical protein
MEEFDDDDDDIVINENLELIDRDGIEEDDEDDEDIENDDDEDNDNDDGVNFGERSFAFGGEDEDGNAEDDDEDEDDEEDEDGDEFENVEAELDEMEAELGDMEDGENDEHEDDGADDGRSQRFASMDQGDGAVNESDDIGGSDGEEGGLEVDDDNYDEHDEDDDSDYDDADYEPDIELADELNAFNNSLNDNDEVDEADDEDEDDFDDDEDYIIRDIELGASSSGAGTSRASHDSELGWSSRSGRPASRGSNRHGTRTHIQLGLNIDNAGNIREVRVEDDGASSSGASRLLRQLTNDGSMRFEIASGTDGSRVLQIVGGGSVLDENAGAGHRRSRSRETRGSAYIFGDNSDHGDTVIRARPARLSREPNVMSLVNALFGPSGVDTETATFPVRAERSRTTNSFAGIDSLSSSAQNVPTNAAGMHPLLSVADPGNPGRRAMPFPSTFFGGDVDFSSDLPSGENGEAGKGGVTARKDMGPLVSDRRWGTDLGDVDGNANNARLYNVLEAALRDCYVDWKDSDKLSSQPKGVPGKDSSLDLNGTDLGSRARIGRLRDHLSRFSEVYRNRPSRSSHESTEYPDIGSIFSSPGRVSVSEINLDGDNVDIEEPTETNDEDDEYLELDDDMDNDDDDDEDGMDIEDDDNDGEHEGRHDDEISDECDDNIAYDASRTRVGANEQEAAGRQNTESEFHSIRPGSPSSVVDTLSAASSVHGALSLNSELAVASSTASELATYTDGGTVGTSTIARNDSRCSSISSGEVPDIGAVARETERGDLVSESTTAPLGTHVDNSVVSTGGSAMTSGNAGASAVAGGEEAVSTQTCRQLSEGTHAGADVRFRPESIPSEVWDALPIEEQLEVLRGQGMSETANSLLDAEIAASGLDREVFLSLPEELRQEILGEERAERRRRNSSVDMSSAPAVQATSALVASTAPQSFSQVQAAPAEGMSENAIFLASLPPDLRRDVLLTAEETFLSTLAPADRLEAHQLRSAMGIAEFGALHNMYQQMERPSARTATSTTNTARSSGSNPGQMSSGRAKSSSPVRALDLIRTVSLADDRILKGMRVPFSKAMVLRLCSLLVRCPRPRAPRSVTRLLAVCCLYAGGRRIVLNALLACASFDPTRLEALFEVTDARRIISDGHGSDHFHFDELAHNDSVITKELNGLFKSLTRLGAQESDKDAVIFRIAGVLNFLIRRTERLVWYDMLDRYNYAERCQMYFTQNGSTSSAVFEINESSADQSWMFKDITELLRLANGMAGGPNQGRSSAQSLNSETLDSVLSLAECVCAPLENFPADVVSALVHWQKKPLDSSQASNCYSSGNSEGSAQATKRLRTEPESESAVGSQASIPPSADQSTDTTEGNAVTVDQSLAVPVTAPYMRNLESNRPYFTAKSFPIQFPIITADMAQVFAMIACTYSVNSSVRKKMLRCLRPLSQHQENWMLLLEHLSKAGQEVENVALNQMTMLLSTLKSASVTVANEMEVQSTAAGGDSTETYRPAKIVRNMKLIALLPELSIPAQLPEMQLLHVIRMICLLRSRKGDEDMGSQINGLFSDTLSSYLRRLDCEPLWIALCDCLDVVRNLEGLEDLALEEDETVTGDGRRTSISAGSPRALRRNSSRNNLEFSMESENAMSLEGTPNNSMNISSSTGLTSERRRGRSGSMSRGENATDEQNPSSKILSSLTSRFIPLIECFLSVYGATVLKTPETPSVTSSGGNQDTTKRKIEESPKASPSGGSVQARTMAALARAQRSTTGVMGERFRKHPGYFAMQMELDDSNGAAARLIRFAERNRLLLNIIIRHNTNLLESSFAPLICVPRCRHLLHFDIKRAYFKMKLKKIRQSAPRSYGGSLRIHVRRQYVFEDSFQQLRYKTTDEMRRRLNVVFEGEEGLDAGGLTREWYGVLAREIFNANYALFTATSDNVTFQPNSQSYVNDEHLSYFKFVGRIIGKAICDGHLLDAHFTRSFYKHILGLPVNYHDLEAIEPEYYSSLKQILEFSLDDLGLELFFCTDVDNFGKLTTVDLIENGHNIPVTDENKLEYVQLVAHHRMTSAIKKQIDSFLEGFHDLVPSELVSIFDAQELELLISGLPDVDIDDLRAHTEYHGYKANDPQIDYFWSVLRSFTKEEKALFLQFVTGSSKVMACQQCFCRLRVQLVWLRVDVVHFARLKFLLCVQVPLEGFSNLQGSEGVKQFNIHKAYGSHLLPSAHTCFNQLDLPEYNSEEMTREKLLVAIREGSEGFGFV